MNTPHDENKSQQEQSQLMINKNDETCQSLEIQKNQEEGNPIKNTHLNDNDDQNCSNSSKQILYDIILQEYGYGWEVWKIILGVMSAYLIDSYFVNFFPTMVTSYEKIFNLTPNQISLLGLLFFLSKMVGCNLIVFLNIKKSREIYLKFSLLILVILNVLLGFTNKLWMLFAIRIVSALLTSIIEVMGVMFLCEFLPTRLRSFTLNSSYMGFSLAPICLNLIQLFTMPNLEPSGVKVTHFYFAIISFICFILVIVFITDSPRNLILNGYEEEAFKILIKLKKGDDSFYTPEIRNQIVKEIKQGINDETKHKTSLFEIFTNPQFIRFTICIGIVGIGTDLLMHGGKLVNNLVLEKINQEKKVEDYHAILIENIWFNFLDPLSCLMFGYLTEVKLLGRKMTIFYGILVMSIVIIPGIFYSKLVAPGFVAFFFFCNVNNIVMTFASEFYPTRIRDTALSWMNFLCHTGAALSQYLLVLPMKIHWRATIITMLIISFICLVAILFNPYETHGQALDNYNKSTTSQDKDEEEKRKLI
jgi:sugar phosphate permease